MDTNQLKAINKELDKLLVDLPSGQVMECVQRASEVRDAE